MRIKIIPLEKKTKINKNIILVCTSDMQEGTAYLCAENGILTCVFSFFAGSWKKIYCFANEYVKGLVTRINNSILWPGIRFMCSFRSTARFAILRPMYARRTRCVCVRAVHAFNKERAVSTRTLNNTHNDAVNRHRTTDRHSHCPTANPTRLFQNKLFILTAGRNIFEIVISSLLSVHRLCCVYCDIMIFLLFDRVRSLASCVCAYLKRK